MTGIDVLNERVTEAILRAERLETAGTSSDIAEAYLLVSFWEEEIADSLPASDEEGAIARRGAVRAALTAQQPTRAGALAERYLEEPDALPELVDELRRMRAQADAALDALGLVNVRVVPTARYRFHDHDSAS